MGKLLIGKMRGELFESTDQGVGVVLGERGIVVGVDRGSRSGVGGTARHQELGGATTLAVQTRVGTVVGDLDHTSLVVVETTTWKHRETY